MANNNQSKKDKEVQSERLTEYHRVPPYFVTRQVYDQKEINKKSGYLRADNSYIKSIGRAVKNLNCLTLLYQLIPVVQWLPKYSVRKNIIGDITSGVTVAVMHIPQGMAYGLLAGVTPNAGLYMAFFPTLVYFLFGTSRHISMGTFAVVSLMTAKIVQTHATTNVAEASTNSTLIFDPGDDVGTMAPEIYTPFQVVTAVCMAVGIYQMLMCVFRLGTLSSLLSEPLVSGFTTAAAVHVIVSQMKDLFGIQVARHKGAFKIIFSLNDIFTKLGEANTTTVLLSVIVILFMLAMNEFLKPWVAKKCRFPIPSELIAVVGGTIMSYLLRLGPEHNVVLVGHIPTGIPMPELPPLELVKLVAVDSISVTIVSYSVVMSMALIFARKHSYEVRPNQELLAMGLANFAGAMFSCVPIACSLSRSLIQEQTGGKTQIASVVSAFLILIVLLWIGPFFESLPRCVLAGVITVALKGMFMQIGDLKKYKNEGILEALTWVITFFSVVLIDIDIGLLIGIAVSLVTLYLKGWQSHSCLVGVIPDTGIYVDLKTHQNAEDVPHTKIFRYTGSINFASRTAFKKKLYETVGIGQRTIRRASLAHGSHDLAELHGIEILILDLSAVAHLDAAGCSILSEIKRDMQILGVALYLASPSDRVYDAVMHSDATGEGPFQMFPTIQDAVLFALAKLDLS